MSRDIFMTTLVGSLLGLALWACLFRRDWRTLAIRLVLGVFGSAMAEWLANHLDGWASASIGANIVACALGASLVLFLTHWRRLRWQPRWGGY